MIAVQIRDPELTQVPRFVFHGLDNLCPGLFAHLPEEIQPIVTFAYITGWRIASEVLPLQWRQVDFKSAEVRLDADMTKNTEGRLF